MPRAKKETIAVICYGHAEFWDNRNAAIKWWKTAAQYCDGCEAERYWNIVGDLLDGQTFCIDEYDFPRTNRLSEFKYCQENGLFHIFKNGTNYRYKDGKISSPTNEYGIRYESCTLINKTLTVK